MKFSASVAALVSLVVAGTAAAQSITLHEKPGTVWDQTQIIAGSIEGMSGGRGDVVVGDALYPITLEGDSFETEVVLEEGSNLVIAVWEDADGSTYTDEVQLTLGYQLRPEAELTPSVADRTVTLDGSVVSNPDGSALTFTWEADPNNPASLSLTAASDSLATVTIPASHPYGTYFFNWTVTDAYGDAFRAQTFVVVDSTGINPFDIATEHAPWVEEAVLYEITPRLFTFRGDLQHVIDRIPELVELGVNTIWIQPIFDSTHDQGYAVLDYFTVRPQLGDEEDVHELVETAHEAGLRVLFDFVPNHSDISHRYAQDAIENGEESQYYDFYMRERDNAPYSSNYNTQTVGEMTFVYYFWDDLVNFNYDNPAVQRFIIEASRYWIEEFDIDGYRFDAVWAPAARNPAFMLEWRRALKRVKPDILMLAEDKARTPDGYPSAYEAFDVAYDWARDPGWISRWQFQQSDEAHTVFNTTESRRAFSIRGAIGPITAPDEPILRYIENNDTPRFITNHTPGMTRLASTLMFTLPGVPMLYNGQEVGLTSHPYETQFIYTASRPIREHGDPELYHHYQHLAWLKANFEPLQNLTYESVDLGTSRMLAFRRWAGDEHVVAVLNPETVPQTGTLALPVEEMGLVAGETYYLTDLFSGDAEAYTPEELAALSLTVDPETALVFALGSEPVQVPVGSEPVPLPIPADAIALHNYPNPFTDATRLTFILPNPARVRIRLYDVLGRRVTTALSRDLPAGRHEVALDGRDLAAGVYFCILEMDGRVAARARVVVGW